MQPIFSNKIWKKLPLVQMIDNEGQIINKKDFITIENKEIIKAYEIMNLSRIYEKQALRWQRQGKILTFPPALGQEAIQVAIAMNFRIEQDWFVSSYRDSVTLLALGKPLKDMFQYWCGNEKGSTFPSKYKLLPINVLIGTQFSHATGIALANKIRQEDSITFTTIGDGGTSSGEFYAAMNFAATKKVPVIFIIQNNQWAISTPVNVQTNCAMLAQKAVAAGIPFFRVDGNDLFASHAVMAAAVTYVKKHQTPILVEALTYRIGPHTTADDPTIYRTNEYHQAQLATCPVKRLKNYLINHQLWDDEKQKTLDKTQELEVEKQYNLAMRENEVTINDIFQHTFHSNDRSLIEQEVELITFFKNQDGN